MATVSLTVYEATRTAATWNFTDQCTAAVAGNDYVTPSSNQLGDHKIMAQSTGGGNLTIVPTLTQDSLTLSNKVIALVAGKLYVFGGFSPDIYGAALTIQVSANTNILVFRK